MAEIEAINKFLVGSQGSRIVLMNPVPQSISPDDALVLAAYLVSMAEFQASHKFEEVLQAVQSA